MDNNSESKNNRNRDHKIIIRVSAQEKESLEKFKESNGYKNWLEMFEANKTDLPKNFELDKQTISTINNIHQIGNNINQIAKYMNSMNELTEEQFKRYLSLVSDLAKFKKELKKKFDI
jgi:hypothetical protein